MPIMNSDFSKLYNELSDLYDGQLLEAKADIGSFINKFGEDTYNHFLKAKDRLKNNDYSVDLTWYVKNMNKEDLNELILSLYNKDTDQQKKRIIQGTNQEIRGKYNYLGEKNGYKVYQPLDVEASMDLGVNTGWCTAGRYGHYGHPEFTPSLKDAKQHWDEYTENGIKFYYFLNPETMYGEYALAVYPEVLYVEKDRDRGYLQKTNFELFNAKDNKDYLAISKLPLDLIDEKIVLDTITYDEQGLLISDNMLIRCKKDVINITIPDNVKSIKENAFYDCISLKSINIPDSVISIEDGAFSGCYSLQSIIIPNSVKSIGPKAFYGCYSLKSITISDNITSINSDIFNGCVALKSITIPNKVISIGESAFYECASLQSITIPNSTTSIENSAFSGCTSLKSITIPNSVTSIGSEVFYNCPSLTSIIIPSSITSLGYRVFSYCSSLESIIIPDSVTSIGGYAFAGCSALISITIPNSVTYIENYAFYNCSSLTVHTNNEYVIEYCKTNKINYQKIN